MSVEQIEGAAPEAATDDFEKAFKEFANPVAEQAPVVEEEQQSEEVGGSRPEVEAPEVETPEQLKARLDAAEKAAKDWEHRYRSDLGRQSVLQKRLKELEEKATQAPAVDPASEKFRKLREDFPEIAEALEEELESRIKRVRGEVVESVEPIKQDFQKKAQAEAEDAVEQAHAGWRDTVKTTEFSTWFADQPEGVKELANSTNPNDAITLLNYFTKLTGYQAASAKETPQASQVADIKQKRQQRLEQNVAIRNTGVPPVADQPDDFEAAFKFFSKKKAAN